MRDSISTRSFWRSIDIERWVLEGSYYRRCTISVMASQIISSIPRTQAFRRTHRWMSGFQVIFSYYPSWIDEEQTTHDIWKCHLTKACLTSHEILNPTILSVFAKLFSRSAEFISRITRLSSSATGILHFIPSSKSTVSFSGMQDLQQLSWTVFFFQIWSDTSRCTYPIWSLDREWIQQNDIQREYQWWW